MDCTGYACPPENSYLFTPTPTPVVETVLANTGFDATMMTGGIITTVLLMLTGGILFAYNHIKYKERNDHD